MKKQLWQIAGLILILTLALCACGTPSKNETEETVEDTVVETTAATEPDPEWFSDAAIDEARACLFSLDKEKDVSQAQQILFPLVEAGNAEAQYYWGYIYDMEIVDNNNDVGEKESLHWYKLAAEQGFPKAYLAEVLNAYVGPERVDELVEAAKQAGLFEMAPEELDADGCAFLGSYFAGNEDYSAALDWYLKAAELGSTPAMSNLGAMYYWGRGVEKDIELALEWTLKAANLGHVYAMNQYGYYLFEDNHLWELIEKKYTDALAGYQAAAESGDPVAMYNIGQMYFGGLGGLNVSAETAIDWYRKAAELGDAPAMYALGEIYEYGYGSSVTQDYGIALDWYRKAAELGDADAMNSLAYMYSNGLGVEADAARSEEWYRKAYEAQRSGGTGDGHIDYYIADLDAYKDAAMELFQKAAAAGNSYAMNNIGYYGYEVGYVYVDNDQAISWYKKAAEEGNATAMENLAFQYYRSENYDSAMEWFIKAYANGEDSAADSINDMLADRQGVSAYFENYGALISDGQ